MLINKSKLYIMLCTIGERFKGTQTILSVARLRLCQMHINCWTTTGYGSTGERQTAINLLFSTAQTKPNVRIEFASSIKILLFYCTTRWHFVGSKPKKRMRHANWGYCTHRCRANSHSSSNRENSNRKIAFNHQEIIILAFLRRTMIMSWVNVFISVAANQVHIFVVSFFCFELYFYQAKHRKSLLLMLKRTSFLIVQFLNNASVQLCAHAYR